MQGVGTSPRIGTAGWSIPRIHAEAFPAHGSHLERYASVFSAVEINTSFYRPHRISTYEKWARCTPESFRFSVKAPKTVSHAASSDDVAAQLDSFLIEIAGLGAKLGAILIQLPPKRAFDEDDAKRLLFAFRDRTDTALALEPRHASWFAPEADALLRAFRIARVAADPPRAVEADRPGGWPGLTYLRLHGSPDIYRSPYGAARLGDVAGTLRDAMRRGGDAWCVFDNTTSYAAAGDALILSRMLGLADTQGDLP